MSQPQQYRPEEIGHRDVGLGHALIRMRIVKLGGSLLGDPRLNHWITAWLGDDPPTIKMRTLWLVGGGERVNAIRRRQRAISMTDSEAHFASIAAMSLTANELQSHRPTWPVVSDLLSIAQTPVRHLIFDPNVWLKNDDRLPQSWSVTSDSIARLLASTLGAEELVLLKSRSARSRSLEENISDGLLDDHFGRLEMPSGSRCRIVNLRSSCFDSTTLSK